MRQSAVATYRAYTVLWRARHHLNALRLGQPRRCQPPTAFWHEIRLAQVPAAMLHRPFRVTERRE